MSRRGTQFDDTVRQHSGWLVPLGVVTIIALLSALFLLFYLGPNPTALIEEHPTPTANAERVALSVGGVPFRIPANYLPYGSARKGGPHQEVAIYTALPDFRGYSDTGGAAFTGNGANSSIVFLQIREAQFDVSETERLNRIYLSDVDNTRGTQAPFGLIQYAFRNDSGYRGEDLFVGHLDDSLVVMRCVRLSSDVPSPNCLRDMALAPGVSLSYRFKRTHLGDWRAIASGVERLVSSFRTRGAPS